MKAVALSRLLALAALALAAGGCTHAMQVRNLQEYTKTVAPVRPLTIVLEDGSTSPDEREYFGFVRDALAAQPAVKTVTLASAAPEGLVPDVTVGIRPRPAYHGSWWNYPITFPGFIVFTHAWNGYVYSADIDTQISVRGDGRAPASRDVVAHYRMRHCDFERGAVTSSGWYTPGWGGLNLVFGFFMVPYDPDSTPLFRKEVRTAYGSYIANSIVEIVNGELAAAGTPAPGASAAGADAFVGHCG